jgi:hypothetical protein
MKTIILILSLFIQIYIFSQDTLVVFDRPGVADSPYLVGKGIWQIENGITYSNKTGLSSSLIPSILLRKYVGYQTEIRVGINYEPQMMDIILDNEIHSYTPIAIGIKHKLWKEVKFRPEASLIVNTFSPIQKLGELRKSANSNFELGVQFQNNINSKLGINYNIGSLFTHNFSTSMLTYAICTNYSITNKISVFGEFFSYLSKQVSNEFGFDGGIVYFPSVHSQIDLSLVNNKFDKNHYFSLLIGYSLAISKH